jgi:hypothetical protein
MGLFEKAPRLAPSLLDLESGAGSGTRKSILRVMQRGIAVERRAACTAFATA